MNIWPLDPRITFLNHGSFGSCPVPVLEFQQALRERMERQPVQFLVRDLEPLLDDARAKIAEFVGAKPDNLVFVQNATSGVNTVLRSLRFEAGDELLVTDHEYNACRNALAFVAERWEAKVVVAAVPFPLRSADEIVDAILSRVTQRTRLALLDHVTSQTALILPIAKLVARLKARGIDTLVDGAHGPGSVPLNLESLGAAYYTGNCHKWVCGPKTAAILHVHPDRQHLIHPLSISHGLTSPRTDRSKFLIEFAWTGTGDPTAFLSVPEALRFIGSFMPGGWPEVMSRNHALAVAGRKLLCDALQVPLPCPDELVPSMASVPIPNARANEKAHTPLYIDPLQDELLGEHNIEVPVIPWPTPPKRLIRISCQLYNSLPQYQKLAEVLSEKFGRR
ncbi:MAG TPA: aminotransferase class V-fold PLP-dependent enzyme [Verrucomicrobiae bacterium]|nr:aminotransferase class V-fold PLP-dependent enzyme [Verrucomicrobiae bacterium]